MNMDGKVRPERLQWEDRMEKPRALRPSQGAEEAARPCQPIEFQVPEITGIATREEVANQIQVLLPLIRERLLRPTEAGMRGQLSSLKYFGLTMLQFRGQLTMSELAAVLRISKQQLTALVDDMLKDELVQRQPDASDRRVIRVGITPEGEKILSAVREEGRQKLAQRLEILSSEELQTLSESIYRVSTLVSRMK